MKKAPKVLTILITVFALDQVTKYLASTYIHPAEPVEIFPFFHLVNVTNVGAAFGMFQGIGNAFFIAISFLAIGFVVFLIVKETRGIVSLTLILSGALGNLTDRLFMGHVRDFLDFSIGRHHWPAFNVADSALTVGLILIVFSSVFRKTPPR
jgi:signal peptidase II